jgi:UDP-glucose 4-epimerase
MGRMKKVLVTGGAGFIGHHVATAWRKSGAHVVVLDSLRTGKRANVAHIPDDGGLTFVEGSITDLATVKHAMEGCSVVHHLAAQVSVPESMERPHECVEINVGGTLNVLDAAKAAGVSRVVFSSSAAVYGDDPRSPKTEDMTPAPKSPYGVTKLDGEYYLKMYAEVHGVPTVSLRYFNVFGPRQDPRSVYAAAVPIFIERALAGADLTIFGDGEQTRDFVFVGDVVAANVLAATSEGVGRGEVFNVAQGGRITINELAETIVRVTASRSAVKHLAERAGDIRHSLASIARIREALQFAAKTSLEAGLRACLTPA